MSRGKGCQDQRSRAAALNMEEQLPKFGQVHVSFSHAHRTLPFGVTSHAQRP